MGCSNFRSLLLAAIVLCNCITWTTSRHHYSHNALSRPRRQGAGLFLSSSHVLPGGEGSGAWGPWGEVSPCSRSCGGGVASQKRICLEIGSDGQPLCRGGDTKYFSCQTQDCPDSSDFRAQQCAEFNDVPFKGSRLDWVPYTRGPNPCELNCMPRGGRFYYRQREKVVDGTRCNEDGFDVCVDGTCQPVGCDFMLGSYAKEDKCRECRGNGSHCHTVKGKIDSQDLRQGYNDVLLIPQGATSIYITESRTSNNYLALRSKLSFIYYLNGDYQIDFPRTRFIAGALWRYERSTDGLPSPDKLKCLGPTTEPLYLSLLLQDRNVGIDYEYSVPSALAPPPNQQYNWVFDQFTQCSASCGGGHQIRNVTCRSREELEVVDDSLCDGGLKPPANQTCATQACAARWVEGPWSPCSKPCGQEGSRSRQVHCEKIITNGYPSIVDDQECFNLLGPKPNLYEECNVNADCPTWFTGPWKPCDKLCDEGKQTRQVVCHQKKSGKVEVLPEEQCSDEKPEAEKSCFLHPCEGVDWVISEWTGCDSCLSTVRTRTAECVTKDRRVVNASLCNYHPRPPLEENCDRTKLPPCTVQWYATQWSNCSVHCGKGVQTRRVFCGLFDGAAVVKVDDDRCGNDTKYKDSKPCEVPEDKCPAKWYAGPWTACNKECGGGEQYRRRMCLSGGKEVKDCEEDAILETEQSCNVKPCDKDETLPLDSSSTPVTDDDYDDEECVEDEGEGEGEDEDEDEGGIAGHDEAGEIEGTASTMTDFMFSDSPSTYITDALSGSGDDALPAEGSGDGDIDLAGLNLVPATIEPALPTLDSVASKSPTDVTTESSTDVTTESSTDVTIESSTDVTNESSTEQTDVTNDTGTDSTDVETSTDTTGSETESTSSASEKTSEETSESSSSATDSSSSSELTSDSSDSSTTDEATTVSEFEISTTDITTESGSTEASTEVTTEATSESSSTVTDDATETGTTLTSGSETSETATEETEAATTVTGDTEGTATTESGATEVTLATEGTVTTESGATEETMTTESGATEETVTTESGATDETVTTESGATEETVTTESGATEETVTTESGATEETVTTESGATEETATTESGATEETITGSTDEETEGTSETTPWDWSTTIEEVTRKSRCKPKKKSAKCIKSQFGCCPDKRTPAAGPFDEGCPAPKTCKESRFGCCPDGVSPAGPKGRDCPVAPCNETLYGCCRSDNTTAAEGNDQDGCPPPPPKCKSAKFGCCKDGTTEAKGPKRKGCPENEPKKKPTGCAASEFGCCHDNKTAAGAPGGAGCPCNATEFGCCPDGVAAAGGTQMQGCVLSCNSSAFGCCPDGETPAHGPGGEGCCLQSGFGCCPDNYKPAEGPHLEGCGCQYAHYGCCPDNVTVARGPGNEGCGCDLSQHGCCPDRHTEAAGPDLEGCGCHTYQFGCCPDGLTVAKGPNLQGCLCSQSTHGCCSDGVTAAQGPDYAGCDCSSSKYGCCPDGQTEAKGEKFLGCTDLIENRQAGCSLKEDRGPCRNYTVNWFYDLEYGGCSRFWYGGCEGNGNRFRGQDECEDVCVRPPAKDACNLPKVKGACQGYHLRWYYDAARETCGQFIFGGCLGNANNFETREACQAQCEPAKSEDQCKLPIERGSCAGNFSRWGYNAASGRCEQYMWGGCEGNANRFGSEAACAQRCDPPGALKPLCTLPQEAGNCTEKHARWSFSQTENRCVPFYYTGCHANENNFQTEDECTASCPSAFVRHTCTLPAETGDCADYRQRWYYDTAAESCRQFYYGGCGGNNNNFVTELECEQRCQHERAPPSARTTPTARTPPTAAPPTAALETFRQDFCFLERDAGPCDLSEQRFAYDAASGTCVTFQYSGCGGNRNNFPNQEYCDYYCKPVQVPTPATARTPPAAPARTATPDPSRQDFCFLERDAGPCDLSELRFAYDAASGTCVTFQYSGCGGNQNNFPSQEYCDYYCKPVQDVCQLAMSAGPCEESLMRWFYDAGSDTCSQFTYGGCDGNRNRFESREDCERRCRTGSLEAPAATTTTTVLPSIDARAPEPELAPECQISPYFEECVEAGTVWFFDEPRRQCTPHDNQAAGESCRRTGVFASEEACERSCGQFVGIDVCAYPLDAGPCGERVPKVYYDTAARRCRPFTYGGCAGGANRFSSVQECEDTCGVEAAPDASNEVLPDCDGFSAECAALRCAHGVLRSRSDNGCERCVCAAAPPPPPARACERYEEECARLTCPFGLQRAPQADGCERCSCIEHPCAGVQCPGGERCVAEAYRDEATQEPRYNSSCRTVNKPGFCPAEEAQAADEPCRRECNDDADCRRDGKCCARGCSRLCLRGADATPATATATPAPAPATRAPAPELPQAPQASSETEPAVSSEEGGRATLRCLFHSNPPPTITWRRGQLTIDGDAGRYRLLSDGALEIVSVYRNDSGVYICVADNGLGTARQEVRLQVNDPVDRPAGISGEPGAVVVGELGRPLAIRCLAYGFPTPSIAWYRGVTGPMVPYSSAQYEARDNILQIRSLDMSTIGEYACQAYNGLGKPASWSVVVQAYRPEGNFYDSPYLLERETEVRVTPKSPYIEPTAPEPQEPEVYRYTVPVSTRLEVSSNSFPTGGELSLPCEVEGYPTPDVYWSKDGARLQSDDRVYLSDARLTISRLSASDAGTYGCHASNALSAHYSTVQISVEGTDVPSSCTDNPFFAKCSLIVRSKFCHHHYYSQFCCKSCVEAGQLALEELPALQASWARK